MTERPRKSKRTVNETPIKEDNSVLSCIPSFTSYFSPSFSSSYQFESISLNNRDSLILYLLNSLFYDSCQLHRIDLMLCYSYLKDLKDSLPELSQKYGLSEKEIFVLCEWFGMNELIQKFNAVPERATFQMIRPFIPSEGNDKLLFLFDKIVFLKELSDVEPFSLLPCILDDIALDNQLKQSLRSRNEQQNELALKIVNLDYFQKSKKLSYYHYFYENVINSISNSLFNMIDPFLTSSLMEYRLKKYCILVFLQENLPDYSKFLYRLIDTLQTHSTEAFQFLFTEIQRIEPEAGPAIQFIFSFIQLANKLNMNYDIRSFFQFSSNSPFSYTFVEDAWIDFMREKVTKPTIPVFKEISKLMSIPSTIVAKAYIWSQLVYPSKEEFQWDNHISSCIDELTGLDNQAITELVEYCYFDEECISFYSKQFLYSRQQLINQVITILKGRDDSAGKEHLLQYQVMQGFEVVTKETDCNFFEMNVKLNHQDLIEKAYSAGIAWSIINQAIEQLSKVEQVDRLDILVGFCIQYFTDFVNSKNQDILPFLYLFSQFLTTWNQEELSVLFKACITFIRETPFSEKKLQLVKLLGSLCQSFDNPELRVLCIVTELSPILNVDDLKEQSLLDVVKEVQERMRDSSEITKIALILLDNLILSLPSSLSSLSMKEILQYSSSKHSILSTYFYSSFYDIVNVDLVVFDMNEMITRMNRMIFRSCLQSKNSIKMFIIQLLPLFLFIINLIKLGYY